MLEKSNLVLYMGVTNPWKGLEVVGRVGRILITWKEVEGTKISVIMQANELEGVGRTQITTLSIE